jgi:hypothetical protein
MGEAAKAMSDGGVLKKMYKSMGMETSVTVQRNVGTVDGQPVHQFSLSMAPPAGAGSAMIKMDMVKQGKLTFVDNKVVIALGTASLEDAVAGLKAGSVAGAKELQSRAELPAGAALYIDYNVAALSSLIRGTNADAADALKGVSGTPILEALYTDADSLKLVMKIPDEMITRGIDAARNMVEKNAASSDDSDESDTSDDSAETTRSTTTE